MHEETRTRLEEVEAAARDARDWLAETIDRCQAGQPLDLEPLTLAHQRLEGLNLGDGECPYVCGECFAVGPERHDTTCAEGRLSARLHGVDLEGDPVFGDEGPIGMHEETRTRLEEVEAAARDARDWLAETIDRCQAGQPLDLEPLTLAHQRLEGLNLGDGECPYVCGECFAVGPERHDTTCAEGRLSARLHGVDLEGDPVFGDEEEDGGG